jgi:hypothetical protein
MCQRQLESEVLMTQLTEEHFELHDRNKDAMLQRNKLKYLEDRISVLEKSLSALNKVVGELQQAEYERDINAK